MLDLQSYISYHFLLRIAEQNAEGVPSLLSFSKYKDVRYDKDIRKSYLQGNLGGIPRILLKSHIEKHR